MYKTLSLNSAFTLASVAAASVARIKVLDGVTMVRFTDRVNTSNLPKGEKLMDIGTKGSGRRIGFKSEVADLLPEPGTKVALTPGKYGWFRITAAEEGSTVSGSIGA